MRRCKLVSEHSEVPPRFDLNFVWIYIAVSLIIESLHPSSYLKNCCIIFIEKSVYQNLLPEPAGWLYSNATSPLISRIASEVVNPNISPSIADRHVSRRFAEEALTSMLNQGLYALLIPIGVLVGVVSIFNTDFLTTVRSRSTSLSYNQIMGDGPGNYRSVVYFVNWVRYSTGSPARINN